MAKDCPQLILGKRGDLLRRVPAYGIVVEVGVFVGDFAQEILDTCYPDRLILVDPWEGTVSSADHDGGNLRQYPGETAYKLVLERFLLSAPVCVLRKTSLDALAMLPDNSCDLIYIDADHSYQAVRNDIIAAWPKVRKNGGILAGHDYSLNKTRVIEPSYYQGMGVKRAVDEIFGRPDIIAMDGYTSWGIFKNDANAEISF